MPASFLPLTLPLFLFIQSNASGFQPRNIQSSQNIRSVGRSRSAPSTFIHSMASSRVGEGERGRSVHNAYCAREAMNYGHSTRATIDGSAALPPAAAVHCMSEERTDKPAKVRFPKSHCDLWTALDGAILRGTRPPRPLLPTLSNYILVSSSGIPKAHSSEILVSSTSGTWDGIGARRGREAMNSSAGERGVRGGRGGSIPWSIHPFSASLLYFSDIWPNKKASCLEGYQTYHEHG